MSEKDALVQQLIDDFDALRPIVLASNKEHVELRAILRRMASTLEKLQGLPAVPVSQYRLLARLLSRLIDAEHGLLLSSDVGREMGEQDADRLIEHVEQRRRLLAQAQQDVPILHRTIARCSALIGREIAADREIADKAQALEMMLRAHLQEDRVVRGELNELIATLRASLASMSRVLQEVGADSSELARAQEVLSQDLPEDPVAAKRLLEQAREEILAAGNKVVEANEAMQQQMQQQMRKMQQLTEQLKRAEAQARNDPLTGLANRRRLAEFLRGLKSETVSFVMLDIDFFKKINDRYGHDAGDEVLADLAEVLSGCVREGDMVARLGGEEFCVVFPDTPLATAVELAEELRAAVDVHDFKTSAGPIPVTVSVGVAQRRPGEPNSAWIKRADEALYASKTGGRNRVSSAE